MSATDFLPRREADLRDWSVVFNNRINQSPVEFGLTEEQAAAYNDLHNTFMAAYALSQSPDTRGPARTVAKNIAGRALRKSARQLAGIVRGYPGITNAKKIKLGLTVNTRGGWYPRHPRPSSAPGLNVKALAGGRVEVRLINRAERSRQGKPRDVRGAILFMHVGDDDPPVDVREWKLAGMTTRTKYVLTLPHDAPPGTPVWLCACWTNSRDEQGPFSPRVFTHTPFRLGAAAVGDGGTDLAVDEAGDSTDGPLALKFAA